MKKKKVTTVQIATGIFIVLYVIWERNMQFYVVDHSLDYRVVTRYDLMFILPVLAVLIAISLRQYFKKKE